MMNRMVHKATETQGITLWMLVQLTCKESAEYKHTDLHAAIGHVSLVSSSGKALRFHCVNLKTVSEYPTVSLTWHT